MSTRKEIVVQIRRRDLTVENQRTVALRLPETAYACAEGIGLIMLSTPNSPKGAYEVYVAPAGGLVAFHLGAYWPKSGERAPRMNIENVGIKARRLEGANAGFAAITNADGRPVYDFTMASTSPTPDVNKMQDLLLVVKDIVAKAIDASSLVPEVAATATAATAEIEVEVESATLDIPELEVPAAV